MIPKTPRARVAVGADTGPLPHLETFVRAAELSNFTGAGKVLGLTQAAVSQRIQILEKSLDTSLFHRQAGRLILTEAGQRLHDYARRILSLHEEARLEIAGQQSAISGDLELGASTIPGEHLLPALLAIFHQEYPAVQVKVAISDSLKVLHQVERGQVSIGLVGQKNDSVHLEFRHYATDRMVLVVPPAHPWAKRRQVTLAQLGGQPLVLREVGSGMRYCFERSLGRAGLSLTDMRVALELGSNEAIKEAVVQGIGAAILSIYAVEKEIKAGLLHPLRVADLQCDREMFVVWDRRRVLPAPARVFRFFLEKNPLPDPAS